MAEYQLITDTASLKALCRDLEGAPFLAVDTEFMRESTYYPELCLVQIASPDVAAAVDPLADIDLTPLLDLIVESDILKVMHAAGQDVEIVYNLTKKTPWPLFDTQIASMALGMGEQISYAALVNHYLGISLDKGARFTDWSRRPLEKRQLDYAVADVTHLAELFPEMLEQLRQTDRGAWLDQDMQRLTDPENYDSPPEKAWRRVKFQGRNAEALGRLKSLAAWREREAREKNLPRGRIVKDETLADLAGHPPKDQSGLARVRGLSKTWATNDIGERLMFAIEDAEPLSADEIPDKARGRPRLGPDAALIADLLKLLLKVRSKEAGVAAKLIGRAEDLERLANGEREDLPLLEGWRYEVFGEDALALVEGQLSFAVKKGKLKMKGKPD
ncbi:ribonuclease D [Pacificimonas flava]|uniref:Ribonuclease D n=2 Tax=Pacificimonas TaxID=1960290 RepID=A0A219B723_9SPHN|nr:MULTISPECIES: ribonuclease D [Pacificimonas]MBZ6378544.1 ribonuclease D [Pacificimonas aurantium]OWV34170.1 ribonuclease D [Pacificimonas flava]